jgi:hypothetical protein
MERLTFLSDMKRSCFTAVIALLLLSCTNIIHARGIQTKLDQVKLFRQFIGTWKCETAKDTTAYWDFRSFGTGLECYVKYVTGGKIISEVKSLYGYDRRVDKFISALMIKGMDIGLFALWFTSGTNYVIIYYSDLNNPEGAIIKTRGEFKSPYMIVVTKFVNDKPVSSLTYTRTD